ncbi:hypothetical protein [Actinomadura monticuli]|uniref:DUF3024 domain-containing protein n=1 Tax=Actinomadura monticuli TaxID=3097367 RepID=A0ABV4Q8B3_9ACTN
MPPTAPTALPPPTYSGLWRARWHLMCLALVLRADGWKTQLRTETPRTLLRVYSEHSPTVGESISVAWGNGTWWYLSSTGLWLSPCKRVRSAADKLSILLKPSVAASFDAMRGEQF